MLKQGYNACGLFVHVHYWCEATSWFYFVEEAFGLIIGFPKIPREGFFENVGELLI